MRVRSSIHQAHFGLVESATLVRAVPKFSKAPAYRGYFASKKALGPARFNSLLERDALILLEADPDVVSFAAEPHKLTYFLPSPTGGYEKREYTPDIVVADRGGNISVIDAKASFFRSQSEWQVKEPIIRQAYEEDHGVPFHVLTEREIRAQPRLANCQIILTHSRGPVDPSLELRIREMLAGSVPTSIHDMQDMLAADGDAVRRKLVFSTIAALVVQGVAKVDLGMPISANSVVREALKP